MRLIILLVILMTMFGLAITPAQAVSPRVYKLGALGNFEKLDIQSCSNNTCIQIKADKAIQGLITGGISIKEGSILIQNQESKKAIAKFNGAVYYDSHSEKIYFTEILNSKFKEAYFDKLSGKFVTL